MILKLKIFLSGNYESKLTRANIQKYLENKYYDVVDFQPYGNYVLDAMGLCNTVKINSGTNVGFLFCNYGQNLQFAIKNNIKSVVATKENCFKQSTYLNTSVLIFSLQNFNEDEIIKIIVYYLELFEQGNLIFY